MGALDVACMEIADCPGLLSRKALQAIGVSLDLGRDTFSIANTSLVYVPLT